MAENWALIKAQYELLEHDVVQIAASNHVSVTAIEYAIEAKGWQRRNLAESLQKLESNTDETEGLIESLALIKEAHLLPQYITVETALLAKILEMVESIPLGLPVGADMVNKLESTFTSMVKTQSLLARTRNEKGEAAADNRLQIVINNRIDEDPQEIHRAKPEGLEEPLRLSNAKS